MRSLLGGDDVENDKGHYCFVDRWRRLWSRDGSRDAEQVFNTARFERQHSNGSANKWRRAFLSGSDWPIKAPTDEWLKILSEAEGASPEQSVTEHCLSLVEIQWIAAKALLECARS